MYYHKGKYRLSAGNPQIFPTRKAAEVYKKHYESYTWFNDTLVIEEVEYDGVPLSESKMYNGKEQVYNHVSDDRAINEMNKIQNVIGL